MHSSRMRTACSRSHQSGGLPQCMLGYTTSGVGLETPPWCGPGDPPGVGLEAPLGVGLETLWVWSGEPPGVGLENPLARPLKLPLGCGPGNLQVHAGIYTPRDLQRYAGIPPPLVDRQTTCKNITSQTSFAGGNY